eukprot:TRINITY_DN1112_c2_g1_i1.p1 TRINITY_DN1112_c2_g1~~TRINITY_DN1112_c2_g1_i1.p1  ORF type:complete len:800 (+),score=97.89 TRINITY_DN1112_c2_g1_i1:145-2544(+)
MTKLLIASLLVLVVGVCAEWEQYALELYTLGGTTWTDMRIEGTLVVITARNDKSLLIVLDATNLKDIRYQFTMNTLEPQYDKIATYRDNMSNPIALITTPKVVDGQQIWWMYNTSKSDALLQYGPTRTGTSATFLTFDVKSKYGTVPWIMWSYSGTCVAEELTHDRNLMMTLDYSKNITISGRVAVAPQGTLNIFVYSVYDGLRKTEAIRVAASDGYFSDASNRPTVVIVSQIDLPEKVEYLWWDAAHEHLYLALVPDDSLNFQIKVFSMSIQRVHNETGLNMVKSDLQTNITEIHDVWLKGSILYMPVVISPLVIAVSGMFGVKLIDLEAVVSGSGLSELADNDLNPLCPSLGGPLQVVGSKHLFALCSHANNAKLIVATIYRNTTSSEPDFQPASQNMLPTIILIIVSSILSLSAILICVISRRNLRRPHQIDDEHIKALLTTAGNQESLPRHIPYSSFGTLEKIAEGNSGCVYKAFYAVTGEFVALKASKKILLDESFFPEMKLLCSLRQKDIIILYGWSDVDSKPYMVTEYCSRGCLAKYTPPHSRDQLVFSLVAITRALSYIHDRGLAHLDVAARNILINETYNLKLADMGLVTQVGTRTSKPLAVAWSPPESLKTRIATRQHDSWSFGCLAYEVLTGLTPFHEVEGKGKRRLIAITNHISAGNLPTKPEYLSAIGEQIWNGIMLPCWQSDPEQRPSMYQLMSRLVRLSRQTDIDESSSEVYHYLADDSLDTGLDNDLHYDYAVSRGTDKEKDPSYKTVPTKSDLTNPIAIPPPDDTYSGAYTGDTEYQFPFIS